MIFSSLILAVLGGVICQKWLRTNTHCPHMFRWAWIVIRKPKEMWAPSGFEFLRFEIIIFDIRVIRNAYQSDDYAKYQLYICIFRIWFLEFFYVPKNLEKKSTLCT